MTVMDSKTINLIKGAKYGKGNYKCWVGIDKRYNYRWV